MQFRLFLFIPLLFFFLSGFSQEKMLKKKVDITISNISISDVFMQLQKTYGLSFNYSNTSIDVDQKVSLDVKNLEVVKVLRQLLPSAEYKFSEVNQKILIYKSNTRYVISGYIIEEGSGEYLADTSIYVRELGIGTSSNAYGFYSLSLPAGVYELFVSSLGFDTLVKKITLQASVSMNFAMNLSTESLDEVVVSSTSEPSSLDDLQMSSQEVTINTVNSLPAFLGENDVAKTFQLFPGVQSGVTGGASLYVRGGTDDQNLILLDEAPVYDHTHYGGFFSIFNGDAISKAELVKGGFNANYGGRLSSVLQIRTKNGNKEKFAGGINIGILLSSLLLEGPIIKNRTSFVISARRTYPDLILKAISKENDGSTFLNAPSDSFVDLNFKLHHVIDDQHKLYWSTYYGNDKNENTRFFSNRENNRQFFWGNIISTFRWNYQITNKMFANTSLLYSNYQYRRTLIDNIRVASDVVSKEIDNLETSIVDYGLKVDIDYYPMPDHTIKFGLKSTFHDFVPRLLEQNLSSDNGTVIKQQIRSVESAFYIQDQWDISDTFGINAGIRFSHFLHRSTSYLYPEPRASLAYRWTPAMILKASYAKMSQYIHRITNFGSGQPTDLWVSSTEDVGPQLSDQVALGLVRDLWNRNYTVEVEGFYKEFKNILTFRDNVDVDSFIIPDSSEQDFLDGITTGNGEAYGGEFLFKKNKGKLTGWLSYTYLKSERKFDGINQSAVFEQRYGRRHNLSINGVYKPSKKWLFSSSWSLASGINYTIPVGVGVAPVINFPNTLEIDQTALLYLKRNNFKGISSHRLDLGVQYQKTTKRKRIMKLGVSIYNVYARLNPDDYYVDSVSNNEDEGLRIFKGSRFGTIPSINYSLKF